MRHLPVALQAVLALEPQLIAGPKTLRAKENALFLGRGLHYPIALEGALKLKEITYIHAEAYPAGELKHGPLALVTSEHAGGHRGAQRRPAGKAQEQHAGSARARRRAVRAGRCRHPHRKQRRHARDPHARALRRPVALLHVVPLQLLAYHTACARGTDVDKPRNLAKSVTVE
jgi:glucosamine--fructose-6-phosphate aminotransferase (isomerizing)